MPAHSTSVKNSIWIKAPAEKIAHYRARAHHHHHSPANRKLPPMGKSQDNHMLEQGGSVTFAKVARDEDFAENYLEMDGFQIQISLLPSK